MASEYTRMNVETKRAHAGSPPGLYRLCLAEMLERAAYYGMRGLLVLFLTFKTQGGLGWSNADALALYGTFTLLVYLLPIPGGLLADLVLGPRRAAVLGGVMMLGGYLLLALPAGSGLYLGVGALLLGSSLFKPSIVTLLGGLYPVEAARRDGGFTLYYLGINIGALLGLAFCSVVSERLGWRWGFGAAGVFMLLSLVTLLSVPAGLLKPPRPDSASSTEGRSRPGIIALLGVFMLVFWTCYELSGGPLNNPSAINWTLLGAKVHPVMFGNAGAWLMLLLAPLLVVLWDALASRGRDPIPPVKMGWGFLLTALGFAFMFGAWKQHQLSSQASVAWLLMTHLFLCLGELCLAPIALSMVTRLAPARFPSLTVATWFLVNLVATKLLFGLTRSPEDFARFDMLFFTGIAVVAAGALLLALAPMLGRWLHGASTASPPFPEAPAHRAP